MKKLIIFISIVGLGLQLAFAQSLDSLFIKLNNTKNNIEKVQVLNQISTLELEKNKIQEAFSHSQLAVLLVSKIPDYNLQGNTFLTFSDVYRHKLDFTNALNYALQAQIAFENAHNIPKIAENHYEIGLIYKDFQTYEKAIENFLGAYTRYSELKNSEGEQKTLDALGTTFYLLQDYNNAEKYLLILLSINRLENNTINTAHTLSKLAIVCKANRDFNNAIKYTLEIYDIHKREGNSLDAAYAANGLGYLYRKINQPEKSTKYFQDALHILQRQTQGDALVLNNIATTYANLGNHSQADAYYTQALNLNQNNKDSKEIANSYNFLAANNLLNNNLVLAVRQTEEAIKIAEPLNAYEQLANSYLLLSQIYDKEADYKKSQETYKKYTNFRNLMEEQAKNKRESMQIKRIEAEQKENEFRMVIAEKEKQELELKRTKLEAESQAKQLQILRQESEMQAVLYKNQQLDKQRIDQALALTQQQLEAEKRSRQIADLELERQRQSLILKEQDAELQQTALAAQKKEQENQLLEKENKLIEKEKEQQAKKIESDKLLQRFYLLFIVLVVGVLGITVWAFINARKQQKIIAQKNEILAEQQAALAMKNEELHQNAEELLAINEQLTTLSDTLKFKNNALNASLEEISKQKQIIEHKNANITASLNYARRIQEAILPDNETITETLSNNFVLFQPRDIVSGDFYWFDYVNNKSILIAADCTGHGVPGAFMAAIGNNLLIDIIRTQQITSPDVILKELHKGVRALLKQDETKNKDGMDLAMIVVDKQKNIVEFGGAKNPLYYILEENGQDVLHELKADKYPIGGEQWEIKEISFTKQIIHLQEKPTHFYLFSDGYVDQFGGSEGRKFLAKRFKNLLLEIYKLPLSEQKQILHKTITDWMGKDHKQLDDIMVLGVKL